MFLGNSEAAVDCPMLFRTQLVSMVTSITVLRNQTLCIFLHRYRPVSAINPDTGESKYMSMSLSHNQQCKYKYAMHRMIAMLQNGGKNWD
jgi:hypothetical protein